MKVLVCTHLMLNCICYTSEMLFLSRYKYMCVFMGLHLHLCAYVCGGKRPTLDVTPHEPYTLFWGTESHCDLEITE